MEKRIWLIISLLVIIAGCKETLNLNKENCLRYQEAVFNNCQPKFESGEDLSFFTECFKTNTEKFFADSTLEEITKFREFCKTEIGFDEEEKIKQQAGAALTNFFEGFKTRENWVKEEQKIFTGEGNQKTEKIYIKNFKKDLSGGGIIRAQFKHTGTSIIIYLTDAQTGKKQKVNTNTKDIVQIFSIPLEKEGEYFFEVEADGKWEIILMMGGFLA